jgi:hypothetical protein
VLYPRFTILPSPCPDLTITQYNGNQFPQFREIFQLPDRAHPSPLNFFLRDPDEAGISLVLENRSPKAVTALSYCWHVKDKRGQVRKQICSEDSYMVDVYQPVAASGSKHLISPLYGRIGDAVLSHVRSGGGIVGGLGSANLSLAEAVELKFEINLVVFEDGEMRGPDPERYAAQLQCRKPAAEFVAKQIRLAESAGRDVTPVLSALASMPFLRDDYIAYWTRHFASHYLRSSEVPAEARLRYIENRQAIPKFYRTPS